MQKLDSIEQVAKALKFPIKTCMRQPITVSPSTSLTDLMYNMVSRNIGAIIVIEKERPVGIITEKDMLERAILPNKDVYNTKAKDIMTRPIVSIEADHSIKEGLDLMRKHQVRRLAVTDGGALVGIVTERRLLAKFLNQIA